MRIHRDPDIDPAALAGRRIAILGHGNQGRAQALNLRDSGHDVRIGARPGPGAGRAAADGFLVSSVAEVAAWADVAVLLLPDEIHADTYATDLAPNLTRGATLVFAHGFSIRFGLITPRRDLDIVLVAPKGPGTALRDEYVAGRGLVALFAVDQDASGHAGALALAYAAALGSGRAGILATSFAEECEADLFNEAAVIWGAVPALIAAGFETLVEAGFAPEIAFFECQTELKLLADLIDARGIAGMREAISNTAEFNAVEGGPRIVDAATRAEMRRILADVRDGTLADKLLADARAGYPRLTASRAAARAHPLESAAESLCTLTASNREPV